MKAPGLPECPACGSQRLIDESPFRTVCDGCGNVVMDDPAPAHWPVRRLIAQKLPHGEEHARTAAEVAAEIEGLSAASVANHLKQMRDSDHYDPIDARGGVKLRYFRAVR